MICSSDRIMMNSDKTNANSDRTVSNRALTSMLEIWRRSGQQHWIPISGNSMLPTIRDGDQALVSHDLSGIKQGEVIVFIQGDFVIAHRVLRICRQDGSLCFITKGDNVLGYDAVVDENDVIGHVLMVSDEQGIVRYDADHMRLANTILTQQSDFIGRVYSRSRDVKRRFLGNRHVPGSMVVMRTVQRAANLWALTSQRVQMHGDATRR